MAETSTSRARTRKRIFRLLLLPGALTIYLLTVPLNWVVESEHAEVFPFFRWKLFAEVPEWDTKEFGLVITSVGGSAVNELRFLIPNEDVRDWKTLRVAGRSCRRGEYCDPLVEQLLVPLIQDEFGEAPVEFEIVDAWIDLRDVRARIDMLIDGSVGAAEFMVPDRVFGRWVTERGEMLRAEDPESEDAASEGSS